MIRKELGKIKSARFGLGGYQDAMFGVSFELGGESWGVGDFKGTWGMPPSKDAKWTVAEQSAHFDWTMRFVMRLLEDAKVNDFAKLVGKPVEVMFESNTLKSWRLLTEVL